MAPQTPADWSRWEHKVLGDLERLEARTDRVLAELAALREQVSALQVRASVWGFLSGALGSALAGLFYVLTRR